MTKVKEKKESVDPARHGELMAEVAGRHIDRAKRKIPPPSEAIFESERRDIVAALDIFMAAEAKREEKGEPLEFEKEIEKEEISLGGGRSFFLHGYIDRVDRTAEDTYRILDYKTGRTSDYENLVEFGRGRIIQHALYAVAAEKILARERPGSKPRVTASGYFFPSRRGEGREIMVRNFDRDRLRCLLNDLLHLLENGYFIAGPEAKCHFCDFAPVCVSGGPDETKRKREANPEVFEAYDKLDEYK
jgi:ATP-dependent helicase/nuclease subunit B